MSLKIIASINVFNDSLETARNSTVPRLVMPKGAAPAMLDGALLGRLAETWEDIEKMLWQGYLYGREAADGLLVKAAESLSAVMDEAGMRFNMAQAWIQQHMHDFARSFIAGSLASIPATQTVGGTAFVLSSIKCSQKINISGNLKASLSELLGLVCEGEVSVDVEYTRA